jgi:hypothetical protein
MTQWHLNPDYMYRRGPDYCVADEQHRLVAMVTFDEDKPQETEEVIANARLIAAAPELLAALKVAERVMQDAITHIDCPEEIEIVRAAINKAEGRVE